jgi:hypothetical protein
MEIALYDKLSLILSVKGVIVLILDSAIVFSIADCFSI